MTVLYLGSDLGVQDQFCQEHKVLFISKSNAIEGIEVLLSKQQIDVIICEYDLPGNDGLYFFKNIQEDKSISQIPFILLVEEHDPRIFKKAFDLGVKDYFLRNTTSLLQLIRRARSISDLEENICDLKENKEQNIKFRIPLSKRIFDVVTASFILIIISPVLLVIMGAIRLESKGRVYYIAKRVGRQTFDFYKLRSMSSGADALLKELAEKKNQYNDTEVEIANELNSKCPRCAQLPEGEYCSPLKYEGIEKICDHKYNHQKNIARSKSSSFIKIVDDPRITKIGKLIRNTSIDELPQLINVIKGDMSLVGNRPLPLYEAELLTKDQASKRFLAPAGITGLWQVELRGQNGIMSEKERMALDNKYADHFSGNNYSFWFDLKILLRTIPALLQKSTV